MKNYGQTGYGKGSAVRPCQISKKEKDLRYALAYGKIDVDEFDRQMTILTGVRYVEGKRKNDEENCH